MIGIAEAIESGELRPDELDELSDEEVIEALVALKGIGQWSAEMFLIFDLGRPDVFSGGDLGLRRGSPDRLRPRRAADARGGGRDRRALATAPLPRVALPLGGRPRHPPLDLGHRGASWRGQGTQSGLPTGLSHPAPNSSTR